MKRCIRPFKWRIDNELDYQFLNRLGLLGHACCSFSGRFFLPIQQRGSHGRLTGSRTGASPLVIYGSIGNVLGSMFNYGVGRMGKMEWIEKYLHVKKESLDKAERFMAGRGAWMGFFAFLPLLGSAITIVLGLTRANIPISILSITIGKVLRYVLLVYGLSFIV